LEIKNKKLLIIGCGKLGQKIGLFAEKIPLELIGFKRKHLVAENIKIVEQNIFDESFFEKVKKISPDFILYSLSADEQSEKSYQRNYFEGLKQVIKSIKYIKNFQHLFLFLAPVFTEKIVKILWMNFQKRSQKVFVATLC